MTIPDLLETIEQVVGWLEDLTPDERKLVIKIAEILLHANDKQGGESNES